MSKYDKFVYVLGFITDWALIILGIVEIFDDNLSLGVIYVALSSISTMLRSIIVNTSKIEDKEEEEI